tara:strand:+ start:531 stop:824 length:294 start_codon:yes stop_codon:yes gene_type:complete
MAGKRLELTTQMDLFVSPTINGIALTVTPDGSDAMFNEYKWREVIDTLIDGHTVTVLKNKDVRISYDSRLFLLKVANSLRMQADSIENKIKGMNVIR